MTRAGFDNDEATFSLLVGYRLMRYLAIEGAYARLGHVACNSGASGDFPQDSGTVNLWPISHRWEVYARLGVFFATNSFRTAITARGEVFAAVPGSINESFSKGSDELYAGAGVAMRFIDNYDLGLEYQRVFDSGLELTGGAGDIDVASPGLAGTF